MQIRIWEQRHNEEALKSIQQIPWEYITCDCFVVVVDDDVVCCCCCWSDWQALIRFWLFENDTGPTNGRTQPLIEMRSRTLNFEHTIEDGSDIRNKYFYGEGPHHPKLIVQAANILQRHLEVNIWQWQSMTIRRNGAHAKENEMPKGSMWSSVLLPQLSLNLRVLL